jgi:hypothetical protein
LFSTAVGLPSVAAAATLSFDVADAAVVTLAGRDASITIHTWSRNTVQLDFPDGKGIVATSGVQDTRADVPIPTISVQERSPEGAFTATLLPEDFPVPRLAPGKHDFVRLLEPPPAPAEPGRPPAPFPARFNVTVMIPESTGLVNVRSQRGDIAVDGYHGTTLAAAGRGRVLFTNVSGDAFVQPLNGAFYATNSTFDRLRIRSNRADQIFDGCRVKQIEATTLTGNIVFDNGIFDPGLARFDSDRGSIALGVNGGAQVGAHTQDGHVLTVLPPQPSSPVIAHDASESFAVAGNGGPLVTVSSNHGDVLLYDGSLAERRAAGLTPPWHTMYDLLQSARGRPAGRIRAPQRHFPAARGAAPRRPLARPRPWPRERPRHPPLQ